VNNTGFTDAFRFLHQVYKSNLTDEEKAIIAKALIIMTNKQEENGGYITQGIKLIVKELEKD
jgi:hypothetical protein